LDSVQNKDAKPDKGNDGHLPPLKVAELVHMWAEGINRPKNGSFAKLLLKNDMVLPEFL